MSDVTILSTNGISIKIDEADLELATKHGWTVDASGYAKKYFEKCVNGVRIKRWVTYLHREIMGNPDTMVDHINQDKLDNRRSNLRLATKSLNALNSAKTKSKAGYRGVMARQGKGKPYSARITVRGKQIHLGCFDTALEAHEAYLIKQREFTNV